MILIDETILPVLLVNNIVELRDPKMIQCLKNINLTDSHCGEKFELGNLLDLAYLKMKMEMLLPSMNFDIETVSNILWDEINCSEFEFLQMKR